MAVQSYLKTNATSPANAFKCASQVREIAGGRIAIADLMAEIAKDTIFYDESDGGVTFSGGEPFMQPIFLQTILKLCKERNVHTAVETCGFVDSRILLATSPYVDLFLYDLKVMDDTKHRKFTGVSNNVILENLRTLSHSHDHIAIRFPVIPGVNDDSSNVSRIGEFVSQLGNVEEVDVLPYHKLGIEKYKRLAIKYRMTEIQCPPKEEVAKIAESLRGYGLKVKIGG